MEAKRNNGVVVSISMVKVNILVLLACMAMLAGVIFIHVLIFESAELAVTFSGMLLFLIAMTIFVVLHEAIHLIGFRYIGGVPKKELDWGVNWKMGVVYAHAKRPVTVKQMKIVLLLPLIPTGILPLIIGISFNYLPLSILGVILTAGCFGDLVLYQKLLKYPHQAFVLDHPSKPQFTVYE
ncbi:DUF3267 domain-containing protein [Virgibacillus kimchii]